MKETSMISELELGKLLAHVDQCNKSIDLLRLEMGGLGRRITAMDKQLSKGKGVFAGIILMSGGLGALLAIAWKTITGG